MQMAPELRIPSMSTFLKGLILSEEKFISLISLALREDFTLLLRSCAPKKTFLLNVGFHLSIWEGDGRRSFCFRSNVAIGVSASKNNTQCFLVKSGFHRGFTTFAT